MSTVARPDPVPTGIWLGSGRPVGEPDPCDCIAQGHYDEPHPVHPSRCTCRGRTDLAHLPAGCCAVREFRRAGKVVW